MGIGRGLICINVSEVLFDIFLWIEVMLFLYYFYFVLVVNKF